MSSTKIINVLKDDSFKEILDLFKATSAEEVIFVLPKRSRAFQKEDHFAALHSEAESLNKSVSFLCSSPELNDLAKRYHFDVLLARSPIPRKRSNLPRVESGEAGSINVVNQIEDFYSEPAIDDDSISIAEPAIQEEEYKSLEHRALGEIKSVWGSQLIVPEIKTVSTQRSSRALFPRWQIRKPNHRTGLIILTFLAIIILGTVIFITTGKAQVTIKPTDQPLDARLTVIASDNVSSIDPLDLAIPGQVFNIQKSVSQDFPATGHVDVAQKARGTITVYNELSVTQPLVVTTRFESADHHIFHTLTSIVVPPAKTSNGKLIPGSIEVQVIADKPGADYNVPVGLFTIPAFKEKGDTDKYKKVYGQSIAAMHSGTSGQATVVVDSDLATAKQTLTSQLTASIQDELKSQINDLKIINDNQINIGQPTSTTPVSATATTFSASLSGSLKTVGFKESDLNSLVAQYLDSHNNVTVIPDKLTMTYDNIHWDETKGGLSFSVHVKGPGYTKVNQQRIIQDLLGKNDSQIKAYLGAISGISEAHVSLSPFWVRSIPKNQDRVKVDLSY